LLRKAAEGRGVSASPMEPQALPAGPGGPGGQLPGGEKTLGPRERAVQLLQEDPARAAGIVRAWLNKKE